jgi:uncharacterized protein
MALPGLFDLPTTSASRPSGLAKPQQLNIWLARTQPEAGLVMAHRLCTGQVWAVAIMCAMTDAQIIVRLQARARGDELVGTRDGVLLARVSAPPVEGRANRALCRLIARRAGVAPSKVTILRGQRSREKLIRVQGIDSAALQDALKQGL